jgi:hypothetical protein
MSSRGVIKFPGGLEAILTDDTWVCNNKILQAVLNVAFGKQMVISPWMGYPPAHRVLEASKWFVAKVIELPTDDYQYPPDAIF